MLSAATQLSVWEPDNPLFERTIIQGHYLHPVSLRAPIIVWRDGRDVMVSWYHHCLLRPDDRSRRLNKMIRTAYKFDDPENVSANMARFIEYSFTRPVYPRFTWADFVRRWADHPSAHYVRYEDLNRETAPTLAKLLCSIGHELPEKHVQEVVDSFSFQRVTGRAPGVEDKGAFMRKGIVGDWENYFTDEALDIFERYAGDCNRRLGYES
ncbi:MAG: sulfotransferase domain-containing protein [Pseudomonadota bacterium]